VTDVDDGAGGPSHSVARSNRVPKEENRGEVMGLEENLDEALSQSGRRVRLVEQKQRMMTTHGPGIGAVEVETERVAESMSEVVTNELVRFPGVVVVVDVDAGDVALVGRHRRGRGGKDPASDRIDRICQFEIAVVIASVGAATS
jgi:hypothetical protein